MEGETPELGSRPGVEQKTLLWGGGSGQSLEPYETSGVMCFEGSETAGPILRVYFP